jgi:hypothetical protein
MGAEIPRFLVSEVVQSSSAATEVQPDTSSAMGKTSVFGGSERRIETAFGHTVECRHLDASVGQRRHLVRAAARPCR